MNEDKNIYKPLAQEAISSNFGEVKEMNEDKKIHKPLEQKAISSNFGEVKGMVKTNTKIWEILNNKGFQQISKTEVVYGSDDEYQIYIRQDFSRCEGSREYLIAEMSKSGEIYGIEGSKARFTPAQIEQCLTTILERIKSFRGKYEKIEDIKQGLMIIEKNRLLEVNENADVEGLTIDEIYNRFQSWFIEHLEDNRVAVFEMGGKKRVALVKRNAKTLDNIFKEVYREIAPSSANSPSKFKGEAYNRGWLVHDEGGKCRDCQLTISKIKREEIGVVNDKVIAFNFPEDLINRLYDGHRTITENSDISTSTDDCICIDECDEVDEEIEWCDFVVKKNTGEVELYA